MFQACSFLVVVISDLGLGDRHLASLVLTSTYDLLSRNPHVDHRFPFPPSWLQLLVSVWLSWLWLWWLLFCISCACSCLWPSWSRSTCWTSFSFSSFLAATASDPLGCCDLDLGGPSLASLMLTTICNLPNHDLDICGLGCNYWWSS